MARNNELGAAKTAKKDEFYTQLTDIEKEMRYYRKHFKGKTVLCNCDDPFESNFFKYFVLNFNRLELKKLIATCYATSPIMGSQLKYCMDASGQMYISFDSELTADNNTTRPYKAVVSVVYDKTGDGGVDILCSFMCVMELILRSWIGLESSILPANRLPIRNYEMRFTLVLGFRMPNGIFQRPVVLPILLQVIT